MIVVVMVSAADVANCWQECNAEAADNATDIVCSEAMCSFHDSAFGRVLNDCSLICLSDGRKVERKNEQNVGKELELNGNTLAGDPKC